MDYLIKNMHFIFIHFPIALLFMSLLFDLISTFNRKSNLHAAGSITLILGTLGAIASVLTGPEGEENPLFPQHELFGRITMFFFIALSLVRLGLFFYRKREIGKNPIYLVAALIGIMLVTYTGDLGGKMVHKDMGNMMQGGPGGQGGQGAPGGRRPGGQGAPGGGQSNQNQQQNGSTPSNNAANNAPAASPK
jgi:uncharacterized membrane protein